MAHQINRLSALAASKLDKPGRHADGGGLYLSISKNGGRRWVYLFRWNGKTREMGIGSARLVSLKEAREKVAEARRYVQDGIDPIGQRVRSRAKHVSFGEYAQTYVNQNQTAWRNDKHIRQWSSTIRTYCKPILDLPIDQIETDHLISILRPIWTTKHETASRVRGRVERILAAAKVEGLRDGENPAQWRNHLQNVLPKRQKLSRGHHLALPYRELPYFMACLDAEKGLGAIALQLTVLTAARTSEALLAEWSEFDLEIGCWTIPASRMKVGRQHRVPLSNKVIDLVRSLFEERTSELVFQGQRSGRPLSNMAMSQVLKRMKVPVTVHGFRSTFRDWASEETDHANEVCELALSHTIKSLSEAAYRRGDLYDKRKLLMQDWAHYCQCQTTNQN